MVNLVIEIWITIVGVVMASFEYFQIVQIKATKSSKDVSLVFWCVMAVGQSQWIFYGVYRDIISLIITNTIGLIMSAYILILIRRYNDV